MEFRVTPQFFISQAVGNVRAHNARLADLQRQASTGLRIQKPSDEPSSYARLTALKSEDKNLDADLQNLSTARNRLNVGVSQLLDVNNILVEARQLAADARQTTERDALAEQIDGLLNRLTAIANTKHDSVFLFGGASSDTEPFQVNPTNGNVEYVGSKNRAETIVGIQLTVDVSHTGTEVFQSWSRGETLVLGDTGAASGTGTDSETGVGSLTVRHTTTAFAGTSGVQTGTNSINGDTVIGPAGSHVLTINDTSGTGASGTISINGGATIAFNSSDTNLEVIGPLGERVFVDTTSISAGFNGNVDITANGTMSVDGGLTETAIDFSANQVLTSQSTGKVTNIDSSGVQRTGTDRVEYTDTADVFQSLSQLRDDLRAAAGQSESEFQESITRRLNDLERQSDSILASVGELSVTLENIDALESRAQDLQLSTRTAIGDIESADLTEVVLQLTNEQNLLQFTFASTAGLLDASLLNFLG